MTHQEQLSVRMSVAGQEKSDYSASQGYTQTRGSNERLSTLCPNAITRQYHKTGLSDASHKDNRLEVGHTKLQLMAGSSHKDTCYVWRAVFISSPILNDFWQFGKFLCHKKSS
ncbi:hypothetical protein BaRGS_00032821 [Batillaria attramentaria]|uniref:Uncharacterized protein n=1 Tax=Batillaria attramentaria TaxID=370345 RepID=A0ABD0JLW7_9CAEN